MNEEEKLKHYLSLDYPIEVYGGEHEIGDAFLVQFVDFDIKASCEDVEEAIYEAKERLKSHIKRELELGHDLPNPNEGVRFMQHREALKAYKAKDYETAMKLWEEESKFKNDQAMTNIGLMYLKGEGVEKDYIKAKEWFEKASEYDNSSANYNLGLLYQNGIGIEADGEKAIYYLRKAVSKNHQGANFRLGLELSKDKTDLEKLKEGFTALLNAAKSGHPMAAMQISGVDKPSSSENLNEEFRSKNKEEQLEVINSIMDIHIRPMLMQDGGNILLLNYLNEPEIEMHFVYQGNCSGCALASTSTYDLIFNTLTKLIDNNIKVYIL